MSNKEWVLEKIKKYKYSNTDLYDMFDDFKEETQSTMSLDSYKRLIRNVTERYTDYMKKAEEIYRDFEEDESSNVKVEREDTSEIKDLKIKVYTLNQKIKELRRENDILLSGESYWQRINESINDLVEVYEKPDRPDLLINSDDKNRVLVALVSDLHLAEVINADETMGLNEYNDEIAKKRIKKIFEGIVENAKLLNVNRLRIELLGDLLSGDINNGRATNSSEITKAVIEGADFLSQCIIEIAPYFDELIINGVVGNHDRLTDKPVFKKKAVLNWAYLLMEIMKRELSDVVNNFSVPESFFTVDTVDGFDILLLHGDTFRGRGNAFMPIPTSVAKGNVKYRELLRLVNKDIKLTCVGHFHESYIVKDIFGCPIIFNGSPVGASEFSIGAIQTGSVPTQTTFCIDNGKYIRYIDNIVLV